MKTRLLTTLIAALLALSAWAASTKINGIYYKLNSTAKTATVTSGSSNYQGDITIPSTVTYDGTTYSVTSIGEDAFFNCSGLTSITIPNSVTSIEYMAFYGCSGLTSITIPNSVTSIGGSAFRDCTGLTSITIPNSVTFIGGWAFEGCTGLTSIKVETGNTKYDSRDNCNAIIETESNTLILGCKATTIPNSVTSIGSSAFRDCTGLTSITIPNSVTSIGEGAFSGCTGLTSITIPNSVTSIGDAAFYGCTGLTSISIPNSITKIRSSAFEGCTGLTSITIPNSVTSIKSWAFEGCTGLTSITIPNSVTFIGTSAFSGCSGLTSITIPNSVTSIGEDAFADCTGLTDVTIQHTDPKECDCEYSAFNGSSCETATLHVPVGCVDVYKNSNTVWSRFGTITDDVAGIEPPITPNPTEEGESYYTLQGQRIGQPQSGIVIVRYSDGSSRKMYVR